VRNLKVSFDTARGKLEVVNDVSFTIDRGEVVGLVGETGCGKTVTAHAILDCLPASTIDPSSRILIKGLDIVKMGKERKPLIAKEMALVPQFPMTSLNPAFTIKEQMTDLVKWRKKPQLGLFEYVATFLGRKEDHEVINKCQKMLLEVGLSSPDRIMESYPFQLSGGMRQRVLIAMALLCEPSLLIADEPATALDVTIHARIIDLLLKEIEKRSLSVLYISHNLRAANKLCDRINVMYAGQIVETGEPHSVLGDAKHPYTRGLINSLPKLTRARFQGIDGRIPDYANPPRGCRFSPRCPKAKEVCTMKRPEPIDLGGKHFVACHNRD
jgi:peptide/nickel transport system ATP-binding protein